MDEKLIKPWLDFVPDYLDFFLKFMRKPPIAFEKRSQTGKVSSDLVKLLLAGIALSYVLVFVAGSPELQNDSSPMAVWIASLVTRNVILLPIVALVSIFILAVAVHIIIKAVIWLVSIGHKFKSPFGELGGVEDSVNAALGFASVYLPFMAAVLCAISWLYQPWLPENLIVPIGVALVVVVGLSFWIYFPWSMSANHPQTSAVQIYFALCVGIALVSMLWRWLTGS